MIIGLPFFLFWFAVWFSGFSSDVASSPSGTEGQSDSPCPRENQRDPLRPCNRDLEKEEEMVKEEEKRDAGLLVVFDQELESRSAGSIYHGREIRAAEWITNSRELGHHLRGKCLCMCFVVYGGFPHQINLSLRGIPAKDLVGKTGYGRRPSPVWYEFLESPHDDEMFDTNSGAVLCGSEIYIVGGAKTKDHIDSDKVSPITLVSSIDTSCCFPFCISSEPGLIQGKDSPAVVEIDNKVYALSGPPYIGRDPPYFEVLDPLNNTGVWSGDLPHPPFLDCESILERGYCSFVVVDNTLHVSTLFDSFYFNPNAPDDRGLKWEKSDLFAEYTLPRSRISLGWRLSSASEEEKFKRGTRGGMPFDFLGRGIVVRCNDVQVLIGAQPFEGHVAFLLENGKVAGRQVIQRFSLLYWWKMPYYTDLGGDGLFCSIWTDPAPFPVAGVDVLQYTLVRVETYRISLLQQRNEEEFLGVEVVNSFTYKFDVQIGDGRPDPWFWDCIGCFLIDAPKFRDASHVCSAALEEKRKAADAGYGLSLLYT